MAYELFWIRVLIFYSQLLSLRTSIQESSALQFSTCNSAGSVSESANPVIDKCLCKDNVMGEKCNECKEGTFDLQKYHPTGCIRCFCSGVSQVCEFKEFPVYQITDSLDYRLQLLETQETVELTKNGIKVTKDSNSSSKYNFVENNEVYWILSPEFNGDKIKSYGKNISLSITYISSSNTSDYVGVRLVILSYAGNLTWSNSVLKPNTNQTIHIPMREDVFTRENKSHLNTREHVLSVLASIESVQLRATQTPWPAHIILENIRMDVVKDINTLNQGTYGTNLEVCECPEGYTGTSCELCDFGYYKKSPSNGTFCVECPCNGHESKCFADGPDSATCICKSGFSGEHCETITQTPSILKPFYDVIVGTKGGSVVLNCTIAIPHETTVSWYFETNSKELIEKKHCRPSGNPICSLKISNFDEKDEGIYICKAYNTQGEVTKLANLRMETKQKNLNRSTLKHISQQCLKIATIVLSFLCILVLIPITLLFILNRCKKTIILNKPTEDAEL